MKKMKDEFKKINKNNVFINDINDELWSSLFTSCEKNNKVSKFNFDTLIYLFCHRLPHSSSDRKKLTVKTIFEMMIIIGSIIMFILKPVEVSVGLGIAFGIFLLVCIWKDMLDF